MAAVWGAGSALGSGVVARGVKVLDPSTDSVSEAGVLVGRQGELLRLETGEGAKSIKEDFRVVACVLLDGQGLKAWPSDQVDERGDVDEVAGLGAANSARTLSAASSSKASVAMPGPVSAGRMRTS